MSLNHKIDICQTACMLAGVNRIESLDDDSAEARLLAQSYEKLVESELALHYWNFATTMAELGSPLANAPTGSYFNVAHQLPNLAISVDTVLDPEDPIAYELVGSEVHTRDTSEDTLVIKYRFRADESVWSPYFRWLIIYRLATLLAFSITRKEDVATVMADEADKHWRRAKTMNSQSHTSRRLKTSALRLGRNSGIHKFWRNR